MSSVMSFCEWIFQIFVFIAILIVMCTIAYMVLMSFLFIWNRHNRHDSAYCEQVKEGIRKHQNRLEECKEICSHCDLCASGCLMTCHTYKEIRSIEDNLRFLNVQLKCNKNMY